MVSYPIWRLYSIDSNEYEIEIVQDSSPVLYRHQLNVRRHKYSALSYSMEQQLYSVVPMENDLFSNVRYNNLQLERFESVLWMIDLTVDWNYHKLSNHVDRHPKYHVHTRIVVEEDRN